MRPTDFPTYVWFVWSIVEISGDITDAGQTDDNQPTREDRATQLLIWETLSLAAMCICVKCVQCVSVCKTQGTHLLKRGYSAPPTLPFPR